jgi:death-on-curing family protein
MIKYLEKMDIVEINRKTLELHNELSEFLLIMPSDLDFIVEFVKIHNGEDIFNKALAYCVSLIVLHPFKNGNHRTSIYSAERFLILNGYEFIGDIENHKELQKWRFEYEEKHDLEHRFAQITAHDSHKTFNIEITKIMADVYGQKILKWLKANYKLN